MSSYLISLFLLFDNTPNEQPGSYIDHSHFSQLNVENCYYQLQKKTTVVIHQQNGSESGHVRGGTEIQNQPQEKRPRVFRCCQP